MRGPNKFVFPWIGVMILSQAPALANRPVPDYKAQDLVQCLEAPYPPRELLAVVATALKGGVPGNQIVVAFDFDRTLWGVNPKFRPGDNPTTRSILRGGSDMLAALRELKAAGVHLVIDTAAGPGGMIRIQAQIKLGGIEDYFGLGDVPGRPGTPYGNAGQLPKYPPKTPGGETVYIASNIISGEGGYDKPAYLDKYFEIMKIEAKLVILMDDGAVNVWTMKDYYAMHHPDCQFIGFHVPQFENPLHAPLIEAILHPDSEEKVKAAMAITDLEPGELEYAVKIREAIKGRATESKVEKKMP